MMAELLAAVIRTGFARVKGSVLVTFPVASMNTLISTTTDRERKDRCAGVRGVGGICRMGTGGAYSKGTGESRSAKRVDSREAVWVCTAGGEDFGGGG